MLTYRQLERELGIPFTTMKGWKWLDRTSVDLARASIVANGKAERLHGRSAGARRRERAQSREGGSQRARPRRERTETPADDRNITMTLRSESLPGGERVIKCAPEEVKFWADTQRALATSDNALASARRTRYQSEAFVDALINAVVTSVHRRDADIRAQTLEAWFGRDLLRELELCDDADERRMHLERAYTSQTRYMNSWQDDDLATVLKRAVEEA